MVMFWGLPCSRIKQDFVCSYGRYPVDTITNWTALQHFAPHAYAPANDNDEKEAA